MQVINIKKTIIKKDTIFSADFLLTKYPLRKRDWIEFYFKKILNLFVKGNPLETTWPNFKRNIWYRLPTKFCKGVDPGDAFFVTAVPMALAYDDELDFHGIVSKKLFKHMDKIGNYFNFKGKKINVKVWGYAKESVSKKPKDVGQFFTLGLDSFYTLLSLDNKLKKNIKYLIYVDGYDIYFNQKQFLKITHKFIKKVAAKTKKIPIFVQSNLRAMCDIVIPWYIYHSAPLAAAGLLLSDFIEKIYFNSDSEGTPEIITLRNKRNHFYSSDLIKFETCGAPKNRITKINKIKFSRFFPTLLQFLRVCNASFKKNTEYYNCSRCEKCTRTILSFRICKVKDKHHLFSGLHQEYIDSYMIRPDVAGIWKEIYKRLKSDPNEERFLINKIEKMLLRNKTISQADINK